MLVVASCSSTTACGALKVGQVAKQAKDVYGCPKSAPLPHFIHLLLVIFWQDRSAGHTSCVTLSGLKLIVRIITIKKMPLVKRCCCCVTLRLGGITMGIMTLALSIFSVIPMVISFVNREFLAQVVTHLLKEMNNTESGMYI